MDISALIYVVGVATALAAVFVLRKRLTQLNVFRRTGTTFYPHAKQVIAERFFGSDGPDFSHIPERLREAHVHSSRNRAEVLASEVCGCFYCAEFYSPREIHEWHDEGRTAFCPKCGIDAVLGKASGLPMTPEFMREMNQYWFDGDLDKLEKNSSPDAK